MDFGQKIAQAGEFWPEPSALPAADPVAVLLAAATRIQQSGIAVEDLGLRRPSLDDVFLMLTGEHALAEARPAAGPQGLPGGKR